MGVSAAGKKARRKAGKRAVREVARAQRNPGLQVAQRFGYVVRGVLYGAMGLLALGAATSRGGGFVDQSGSLWLVAHLPFGRLVIAAFVVGIGAYAAWGFVRAVYDPLRRGEGTPGLANRLGWAWSGTSYALLTLFALRLTLGKSGAPSDPVRALAERLFDLPGGRPATVLAGLIAVGAGIAQLVDAYWARWRRDLKRNQMSDAERTATLWLGRAGLVARGIVFSTIGWLLVVAGWSSNPETAHGYAGAFQFVGHGPAGRIWLGLVAVGFVALGLHSLACARWMKLVKS